MERINLPKHVRTLATLPVTDAPVVSCYQSLDAGRLAGIETHSMIVCSRFGGD